MEKEFVPYEQASELKELGFDEPCFGYYIGGDWDHDEYDMTLQFEIDLSKGNYLLDDKKCTAPTYSQAFKWFREKHRLYHSITREIGINTSDIFFVASFYKGKKGNSPKNTCISSKTYEEAELECLKKLIQITNEKI